MFRAKSHRFLVPFDGTFKIAKARTKPPKKSSEEGEAAERLGDRSSKRRARSSATRSIASTRAATTPF